MFPCKVANSKGVQLQKVQIQTGFGQISLMTNLPWTAGLDPELIFRTQTTHTTQYKCNIDGFTPSQSISAVGVRRVDT